MPHIPKRRLIKTSSFSLFLSIALWNAPLFADPPLNIDMLRSVVLLSGPGGKACATAFFTAQSKLVTNAHAVAVLCPYGDCSKLKVFQATALGEPPTTELKNLGLTLDNASEVFDLAILSVKGPLAAQALTLPEVFKGPAPLDPAKELFMLGFPRCRTLELSRGMASEITPLGFTTSMRGAHGVSGSPVFDADLTLVGVVNQSSSLLGALNSRIFGTTFGIKAVRADFLNSAGPTDDITAAKTAAEKLLELYREHIRGLSGVKRAMAGFNFLSTAEGFKRQSLKKHELRLLSPLLAAFGEYISVIPTLPATSKWTSNDAALAVERLMAAYNLELLGARRSALERLEAKDFERALEIRSDKEQIREIMELVDFAVKDSYPGAQIFAFKLALAGLLILMTVFILWAYSLGIVFAKAQGGLIQKFCISAAVGIFFWPLSFIFFLARTRGQEQATGISTSGTRRVKS